MCSDLPRRSLTSDKVMNLQERLTTSILKFVTPRCPEAKLSLSLHAELIIAVEKRCDVDSIPATETFFVALGSGSGRQASKGSLSVCDAERQRAREGQRERERERERERQRER